MWIVVTAGVAVVVLAIARRRRAATAPDLGWVTERWLAVYRADQASDSR
jgi:hypothetical protein